MKKLFFFFAAFFVLHSNAQSFFLPSDTTTYHEEVIFEKRYPTMEEYYDSIVRIMDSVNSQMMGSFPENQVTRLEYMTVDSTVCSLSDATMVNIGDTITEVIKPGKGVLNFYSKGEIQTTPGREKMYVFASPREDDSISYHIALAANLLIDIYVHAIEPDEFMVNSLPKNNWQFLGTKREGYSEPFMAKPRQIFVIVFDNIYQGGNTISFSLEESGLPVLAERQRFKNLDINKNTGTDVAITKNEVEKSNKDIISEFDETTSNIIIAEDVKDQTKTTNQIPTSFKQVKRKQTNEIVSSISTGIINDIPPVTTPEEIVTETPSITNYEPVAEESLKDSTIKNNSLLESKIYSYGSLIGGIMGILLLSIFFFFLIFRKKKKDKEANHYTYSIFAIPILGENDLIWLVVLCLLSLLFFGLLYKKLKNSKKKKEIKEEFDVMKHTYNGLYDDDQ